MKNDPPPIRRLADGTIKQTNPLSGTQVWTVPGRGHRPLGAPAGAGEPIDHSQHGRHCAFCHRRYLDTPPEKSRLVRTAQGYRRLDALSAIELDRSVAHVRRVPNLFEILSLDYWQANHGYKIPDEARARMQSYLSDPVGRAHAMGMAKSRWLAGGGTVESWEQADKAARLDLVENFFAGGHDVIIGPRHFVDGATTTDQLAGVASLAPDEHLAYLALTIDAMADLWQLNDAVRYVATFQNWLRPAGASFDHLHKQVVAIDEPGEAARRERLIIAARPDAYREAVEYARSEGLVVAENDHAVAFAGYGHRFPTLEIHSKADGHLRPWEHSPEQVAGMAALLRACHVATGDEVPSNEEWHYRPRGFAQEMPWRINLKWRISTLAGFEGGTKININTLSPYDVRDRALSRLSALGRDPHRAR
ncbi:DUF4921 family protein [Tessaracoccus caeni]|uniref:DUF4921 family protein n=1 Tax=Tessaracoccus caeni TaxID=3031239 RepID=UPI0023D9AF88|nr:DUF4921 family protein [Tessaracoccus caeni]MDF1487135.1 DUF4921 family protein [Tessaracoccus caeni]